MPLFHTDHESHESHFRIRENSWNFANFLSKSWSSTILLQYRYDKVTNIRGIRLESLKYCQEFTTIYKNRLRILHERIWISYESVKNMPNVSTNQVRIKLNSWLFLTIRGIFPQDRHTKWNALTPAWVSVPKWMFNVEQL